VFEWWRILGIAAGSLLCAVGLWVVRLAQRDLQSDGAHDSTSGPMRLTLGVICLFWGFHAAVWSMPPASRPVSVPVRLWWVALLVTALAIGGSWAADRLDRRGEAGERGGDDGDG